MLGGRAGRIILLGDGTEIHTDATGGEDDDVDMDRVEELEENDVEEQVKKGQAETNGEDAEARKRREGTPGPSEKSGEEAQQQGTGASHGNTPDEPKMSVPVDTASNEENKTAAEEKDKQS